MPNDLEHEQQRFLILPIARLRTRLNRITDLVKVSNFIIVADGYSRRLREQGLYAEDYRQLAIEARERIAYLTSLNPPSGPRAAWRRWRESLRVPQRIEYESPSREEMVSQVTRRVEGTMIQATTTGLAPSGMYGPSFMMVPFTQDDMMRQAVQEPAIIKEEERPEPMVRVIRFKGRGSNEGSSGTE